MIKVLGAILDVWSLVMCPDNEWDSGEVNIPSALLVVLADTVLSWKNLCKPAHSSVLSLGCGVECCPQAGDLGWHNICGTPVEAISQYLFCGRQPQTWENTPTGVASCRNAYLSGWQHWSVQRFKLCSEFSFKKFPESPRKSVPFLFKNLHILWNVKPLERKKNSFFHRMFS